jgi:hypothetical protein
MPARRVLTGVLVVASVGAIAAQSGTGDGVAALARGDYQRAVEILQPIADDWRTTDTAAQFFMAGLYESGRGVPADAMRACALYWRAAGSQHAHPLSRIAEPLFLAYLRRGPEVDRECQFLATIGFDHGFEPVTFDLGPRHTIEWTAWDATVTHNGRTKIEAMPLGQPGARFLPLRHTELLIGPAGGLTRHFIEVFVWYPTAGSGPWSLYWHLFEVAGNQVIRIDTASPLVTVQGNEPPARDKFDVREYATVRVGDSGHPEWVVLQGPNQRTEQIESETERHEVSEAKSARDAAMNRVDWDRRLDVHRPPAMTYVDAEGCGHVHVYGWTADQTEALVVRIAARQLGLTTQPATFDLTRASVDISIEAHVFADPQRQFSYCSDVVMPRMPGSIGPEMWRAVAGTITVELSPPGIRARSPHLRRATVTLSNVVLQNAGGTRVTMPRPVRLTAIVGSMGG